MTYYYGDKMTNVIVEHRWKPKEKDEVVKVVGGIVDMSKTGKLPEGFKLNSIQLVGSEDMAICNWEAPSAEAMRGLLEKVNPPTKHKVYEATKIF